MCLLFKYQTKCDCNGIALGAQVCNSNYDARSEVKEEHSTNNREEKIECDWKNEMLKRRTFFALQ